MVRAPFYDENGIKKGAWSAEEDEKLRAYVQEYGHCNWRELPRYAGLLRCGKSCRLRWINYLRPDVKRGNYSKEEEQLILQLHQQYGNKWSMIATKLPGRTDNEIKNYWHTHLKKVKSNKNAKKHEEEEICSNKKPIQKRETTITSEDKTILTKEILPLSHQIFESSSFSTLSSEISTVTSNQESTQDSPPTPLFKFQEEPYDHHNNGDFWANPLFEAENYFEAESDQNSINFGFTGGFNHTYDFELLDENYLLDQAMKELPENYQSQLYLF
ncbi:transcription factor MYB10-like [Cucumis sativus]|uniref:transcription factor MYB10-like n=1 Tax=Cucumis sativus TaxID=3659 RepID=UPI0002B47EE8|nr:transcription factor MYB10-like [Cucumis sativus]KAE8645759.1 hypothetical protein Csa_020355 [Cucumis sativus]